MNRTSFDVLVKLPKPEATSALLEMMRELVGEALKVSPAKEFPNLGIFSQSKCSSLGIDSFTAMSLLNRLRAWGGIEIPTYMLIGDFKVIDIVEYIYQKVLLLYLSQGAAARGKAAEADSSNIEEIVV